MIGEEVGFWVVKRMRRKRNRGILSWKWCRKGVERVHFVGECVSRWHFKNGIV